MACQLKLGHLLLLVLLTLTTFSKIVMADGPDEGHDPDLSNLESVVNAQAHHLIDQFTKIIHHLTQIKGDKDLSPENRTKVENLQKKVERELTDFKQEIQNMATRLNETVDCLLYKVDGDQQQQQISDIVDHELNNPRDLRDRGQMSTSSSPSRLFAQTFFGGSGLIGGILMIFYL